MGNSARLPSGITVRDQGLLEKVLSCPGRTVHVVAIATKPDIIKQAPVYSELKRRNQNVVLVHTGQHYDFALSGGLEDEFGLLPDINLNIRGSAYQQVAQIVARLGEVICVLKEAGKRVIAYVHGDTTTAMAVSNAAFLNQAGSVHVEAGLRTLTPKKSIYEEALRNFDLATYRRTLSIRENYERGSAEPYPEQYNTRTTDVGSGLQCAPVWLNEEFLINEGFPTDRIFLCGNSVVDSIRTVEQRAQKSDMVERFPILQGEFVRFCIHRRENCRSETRFRAIFEAMKELVLEGRNVLLISLFATEQAIGTFGLRRELEQLRQRSNFIYSKVWPYYRDVVDIMKRCAVCATDSGSMQEEMNILKVPCVTLRFGSDRAETFMEGGNIPAPPINTDVILKIIRAAWGSVEMKTTRNLYGENVARKIVTKCMEIVQGDGALFRFEEDRLGSLRL